MCGHRHETPCSGPTDAWIQPESDTFKDLSVSRCLHGNKLDEGQEPKASEGDYCGLLSGGPVPNEYGLARKRNWAARPDGLMLQTRIGEPPIVSVFCFHVSAPPEAAGNSP